MWIGNKDSVTVKRTLQLRSAGATTIGACPFCMTMLRDT
jgi:hypothetical protein